MKAIFKPFIILLIFSNVELKGQQSNFYCNEFTIIQTQLPNYLEFDKYFYNKGTLFIYKNTKAVYRRKLNEAQVKKLDSILINLEISKLDSVYSIRAIDGTDWEFNFSCEGVSKKVSLGNYYHPQLDLLLKYVNEQIPLEKQTISFSNGFFTNLDSKSDTSIIILPDFYANEVILPDSNYFGYDIICYKSRNLLSTEIDSIVRCECLIYASYVTPSAMNDRKYWVCKRINSDQWEKVIYNNQNESIGEYIIQEIRPFEFLNLGLIKGLTIENRPGDRPSVILYKYYRTIQKNNR